jgi:hypothetical protein
MENNNTTPKLIRGDESVENQSNTSSPSDGASCSESSFLSRDQIRINSEEHYQECHRILVETHGSLQNKWKAVLSHK